MGLIEHTIRHILANMLIKLHLNSDFLNGLYIDCIENVIWDCCIKMQKVAMNNTFSSQRVTYRRMWQIVSMLCIQGHGRQLQWTYTCKCVLRFDHESLWKTLCDRVKVRVKVSVRAGMDGWSLCPKRMLMPRTAFCWIQLRTQSIL